MYLFNDEIIREGTIGRKMFFISRGTVRVCSSKSPSTNLTDGSFFGEISLILPNLRRVASIYADSYCYLYSLTVDDFNSVLEKFPMQRKYFYAEAGKRLEQMKTEAEKNNLPQDNSVSKTSLNKHYFKRRKTQTMRSNCSNVGQL